MKDVFEGIICISLGIISVSVFIIAMTILYAVTSQ